MNAVDTYRFLSSELAAYRQLPYQELVQNVGQTFSHRVRSQDAIEYEIDISIRWSNRKQREILVEGTIAGTDWGGPTSRLDESFTVFPSQESA